MIRQGHFVAVVASFLMGCSILLVVGCAGVRPEASEEEQGHTEATKEQERSPEATASEEARCEGTRTIKRGRDWFVVTKDVPGCPNGGLLSGTDGRDELDGKKGNDEIHGLGGSDSIFGGAGNDVIYGGRGNDTIFANDGNVDIIDCGKGTDEARYDQALDTVKGCETKQPIP